jgi:hypothetical protein
MQRISSVSLHRSNRQINRKLKPLENRLNKVLLNFYTKNIKGSLSPVQILKQKYDRRLKALITKPIQDAYMVAVSTVADKTDIPVSLSPNDLINIQNIVNQTSEAFWNTCIKLVSRQIEFDTVNKIAAINLFSEIAAFIGNAVKSVFQAFNTGIISKLSEVRSLIGEEPDISTIPVTGVVRFMTAGDSKVDPVFCAPLDGQEFDINDPDLIDATPPLHLHCRCRLVPV